MARPRTPTKVLEATGAFEKHPERKVKRSKEPIDDRPIGPPPEYFDEKHKAVWQELISEAPKGVLTKADRTLLEMATRLRCKMRFMPGVVSPLLAFLCEIAVERGMDPAGVASIQRDARKLLSCSAQEISILATLLTRMGMTPADRSRVNVEKTDKQENDPLAAAMQKLGALRPTVQ